MSSTSTPTPFQSLSLLPRQVVTHYPRAAAHVTSVLCTCGLLWLANVVINAVEHYRQLPSGPWGIPFIGYYPFMRKDKPTYKRLAELGKKYGPVFRFKLGGKSIVVINEWNSLYEVLHNPSFLGRPEQTMLPGIINHLSFLEMSGQDWKEQRYRSMEIIQQVLDSQERYEDRVNDEIAKFINLIRLYTDPIDFGPKVTKSISNNITIILFGRTYDYEDQVKKELDEQIEVIFSEHRFAELFACAPWLAKMYLVCGRTNMDHIAEAAAFADNFFQRELEQHLRTINLAIPEPRDFIDGYLKEMATRETARLPEGQFNMEVMKRNAFALYCAAIEKVTSSMLWMMYYLISYPEMQEKIRDEIANVIGFHRSPTLRDNDNMPYTNAFLNEVHRLGSVVAVNLMRRTRYDVLLEGKLIPKNTYVLFNFWSIHRDPQLFKDPEKFDPDRYLFHQGTELVLPPYLVPFGGGKRSCPGDYLSNAQLFLYLVGLLQKFRIKVAPESEITSEVNFRITRRPAKLPPLVFENLVHD